MILHRSWREMSLTLYFKINCSKANKLRGAVASFFHGFCFAELYKQLMHLISCFILIRRDIYSFISIQPREVIFVLFFFFLCNALENQRGESLKSTNRSTHAQPFITIPIWGLQLSQ